MISNELRSQMPSMQALGVLTVFEVRDERRRNLLAQFYHLSRLNSEHCDTETRSPREKASSRHLPTILRRYDAAAGMAAHAQIGHSRVRKSLGSKTPSSLPLSLALRAQKSAFRPPCNDGDGYRAALPI